MIDSHCHLADPAFAEDVELVIDRARAAGVERALVILTGGAALADAGLALGFYISFAGIVTFPKAEALRATARRVPLDRLLIETDSPFLAPVPHRGKRNEPAHVVGVAAVLAGLHGLDAA